MRVYNINTHITYIIGYPIAIVLIPLDKDTRVTMYVVLSPDFDRF